MPVETRSQRKSVSNSNKDVSIKDVSNKGTLIKDNIVLNIQEKKTPIFYWFIAIANRYAEEILSLQTKKTIIFKYNVNKHRQYHYEQLRLVTELYSIIQEYFPEVYNTIHSKRLANTFYTKIQSFDHQIRNNIVIPRNAEEYKTVRVALNQLQDTAKMLIPYLEIKNKRFPPVDYTGMDSIIDEYDGITDIWEDTTIGEDPDYDPEEEDEEGANP